MKKIYVAVFTAFSAVGFAQWHPSNDSNWAQVFADDFNYNVTQPVIPNTDVVNYLNTKWVIQHGEKRYGCENAFVKDQLALQDGSLFLCADDCPSGGCMYNYQGSNYVLKNGNGVTANFRASELYTKKKFMFGYFEARVKLPSGRGTFPGFWLMPIFMERKDEFLTTPFKYGYPEEMDIIEQRSVYDADDVDHRVRHVQDFCSFWNGNYQYDGINSNQHYMQNKLVPFEAYGGSCNKSLAGEWHTLALEWDIFGQKYYIDGQLIDENNLWNRIVNTESMNLVFTNAIQTHFTGSYDNTYFNTPSGGNYKVYYPAPGDPYLKEEKVKVDWVKVFQKKKFNNQIVWASGKTDKIGNEKLNNNHSLPMTNVVLVGDFVPESTNQSDEVFVMNDNGQHSTLQRFVDNMSFDTYHPVDGWMDGPYHNETEVWQSKELWEEESNSEYGFNRWNDPTLTQKTKWVVGNFDGATGDEIFTCNTQSQWSAIRKFNITATLPTEIGGWGGPSAPNILPFYYYNTTTSSWAGSSRTNAPEDRFIAGNFDLENSTNTDELLCFNTSTNNATVLAPNANTVSGVSYFWKKLNASGVTTIGTGGTLWTPDASDVYIVGNFDTTNDVGGQEKEELLCIRKSTGFAAMYKYVKTSNTTGSWSRIWVSPLYNPALAYSITNPYCINLASNASTTTGSWWLNPGEQAQFTSGKYLNDGRVLLLCMSEKQKYTNLYQFNPITGYWIIAQGNETTNNTALTNGFVSFPYKFSTSTYANQDSTTAPVYNTQTRVLTIEKYYNANCASLTPPQYPNSVDNAPYTPDLNDCVKYFTSLVSFNNPTYRQTLEPSESESPKSLEKPAIQPESELTITPNPSQERINLSILGAVSIFDMNGRLISTDLENAGTVSIHHLPDGVYIVKVSNPDGEYSAQLIKK
ncbi:T9SS type A sorting domain-containing protein [Flavobacterium sp. CYK-55]|uniref:T9SS type A sorting domain-containing protein n=1 Tax=Flavobacterium sp. CYK-55 TaxID=2835529 RepID=UPI001BD13FCA|nr:T9SS type A sorting domain-containing protein [Flavobacterium sp. CYK-55]MBS7787972.1 T9SS type A sorting domain-containing protein [Flavobacterium sp. CYK-55]